MQLKIKTSKRVELVDITSEVQEEVRKSEISEGICLISTQHTTAGIIINENETGLKEDILDLFRKESLSWAPGREFSLPKWMDQEPEL